MPEIIRAGVQVEPSIQAAKAKPSISPWMYSPLAGPGNFLCSPKESHQRFAALIVLSAPSTISIATTPKHVCSYKSGRTILKS